MYCRVLPRTAKVDLDLCHQPPCLLNEFYFLSLTVNNKEDVDISNVRYVQRVGKESGVLSRISGIPYIGSTCTKYMTVCHISGTASTGQVF